MIYILFQSKIEDTASHEEDLVNTNENGGVVFSFSYAWWSLSASFIARVTLSGVSLPADTGALQKFKEKAPFFRAGMNPTDLYTDHLSTLWTDVLSGSIL